ncbi:oligosaccharide flippase family protein [Vibrio lentus]
MSSIVSFTLLSLILKHVVQVSILVITTRTLSASFIGDLVLFNVAIGLLVSLAQLGVTPSIINKDILDKNIMGRFIAIMFVMFSIFSSVLFLLSPSINGLLNNNIIDDYLAYIILIFLFRLLYLVSEANLMKSLMFKEIFFCEALSYFLGLIAFLTFMLSNQMFFGVIMYYLTQSLSLYFISSIVSKTPLVPSFNRCFSEMDFTFSWKFGVYQLVSVINVNIDNIFISRYFGSTSLAYYSRSYQLFVMPAVLLGQVVSKVSFPYLKEKKNEAAIQYYIQNILLLTLSISLPISVFVFFSAKPIVLIIFGDKWIAVAEILKVFSMFLFFRIIYKLFEPVLLLRSNSKALLTSSCFYLFSLIFSLYISIGESMEFVAMVVGICVIIYSCLMAYPLKKELLVCLKSNSSQINFILFITTSYYVIVYGATTVLDGFLNLILNSIMLVLSWFLLLRKYKL